MPDDQKVVHFDTGVAEELLDLVDDRPGQADEDLLDEAKAAIDGAGPGLPGPAQQEVAKGEAVAVGLDADEAEVLTHLIVANDEKDPRTLRSIGMTLKSKLKAAAKKAGQR